MKRFINGLIFTVLAMAFFACKDNNNLEKLRQNELEKLDAFISANYPNELPKSSGLYYIEEVKGTGDTIVPGDRVQIFYATWTVDSLLIDETNGFTEGFRFEPYEYIVGAGTAITGLEEASTYMQLGTVANLVLPSELAYGQNGTTGVAGFTTLLMRVEVYKVYRAATSSGE